VRAYARLLVRLKLTPLPPSEGGIAREPARRRFRSKLQLWADTLRPVYRL